jgi:hypothetical protein
MGPPATGAAPGRRAPGLVWRASRVHNSCWICGARGKTAELRGPPGRPRAIRLSYERVRRGMAIVEPGVGDSDECARGANASVHAGANASVQARANASEREGEREPPPRYRRSFNQSPASGGSVISADAGRPPHGSSIAVTLPKLPTPEPPKSSASELRISSHSPANGRPTR